MADGKIIDFDQSSVLEHSSGYKANAAEGRPFENSWVYYNHASGNFRAGIWDCRAGSWSHEHPKTEFCYIVEGSVKIREKDGPVHTYNAGDSFIIPKGAPVTWIVDNYVKKLFVGAEKLDSCASRTSPENHK